MTAVVVLFAEWWRCLNAICGYEVRYALSIVVPELQRLCSSDMVLDAVADCLRRDALR